jgi:hypothetical protein
VAEDVLAARFSLAATGVGRNQFATCERGRVVEISPRVSGRAHPGENFASNFSDRGLRSAAEKVLATISSA